MHEIDLLARGVGDEVAAKGQHPGDEAGAHAVLFADGVDEVDDGHHFRVEAAAQVQFGIAVLCDGGQCRPCGQPAAEARQWRSGQRQGPIRGDAAKRQRSAGRQAKTRLFRALYVQKRRARFARIDRCQARDERFHVHRMLVKQA